MGSRFTSYLNEESGLVHLVLEFPGSDPSGYDRYTLCGRLAQRAPDSSASGREMLLIGDGDVETPSHARRCKTCERFRKIYRPVPPPRHEVAPARPVPQLQLLDGREMASILGITRERLCSMALSGRVPAVDVGTESEHEWRFLPDEVLRALRYQAPPQSQE